VYEDQLRHTFTVTRLIAGPSFLSVQGSIRSVAEDRTAAKRMPMVRLGNTLIATKEC
jgi:hypothetical protein